jgi:succinylarginine dihydrolase
MTYREVIFVGLPGPYHNYGGLSQDNVASTLNRGSDSNPKEAALQALELVSILKNLGITVGILPPLLRPHIPSLKEISGNTPEEKIAEAARRHPELLESLYSSSAMWTANAATVAPSPDTSDGTLHLTTANLHARMHRRIEAEDTHRILSAIFADISHFVVHSPLDVAQNMRDEGAANHTRLAPTHDSKGLHLFVYGAEGKTDDPPWARQTLAASKQVAVQHRIPSEQLLFVKQNPDVIAQGVFHNDVIAVGHLNCLLFHEQAYADGDRDIARIASVYNAINPKQPLCFVKVTSDALPVADAIKTYLFNSQLVSVADGTIHMIAPKEAEDNSAARSAIDRIVRDADNPIASVTYVNLRQSMRNGGGPACLRLRAVMSDVQVDRVKRSVRTLADDSLLQDIKEWIHRHYPDRFTSDDMRDPSRYQHTLHALHQLGDIMKLPIVPPYA